MCSFKPRANRKTKPRATARQEQPCSSLLTSPRSYSFKSESSRIRRNDNARTLNPCSGRFTFVCFGTASAASRCRRTQRSTHLGDPENPFARSSSHKVFADWQPSDQRKNKCVSNKSRMLGMRLLNCRCVGVPAFKLSRTNHRLIPSFLAVPLIVPTWAKTLRA